MFNEVNFHQYWLESIYLMYFLSKSCFTKVRDGAKMTELLLRVAVRGPEAGTQTPSRTEPQRSEHRLQGDQPKLNKKQQDNEANSGNHLSHTRTTPNRGGRLRTCGISPVCRGTAGSGSGSAGLQFALIPSKKRLIGTRAACLFRRGVRLLLADPRESAPANIRARETATSVFKNIL